MDLSWLSQLDLNTQNLLVGAAGNLVGNLATQVVNGLLNAGTRQVRRRFEPTPERQALDAAMAQALAVTMVWLTDDPDEIRHLSTLFAAWLDREAVTDELYQLLEPNAETTWDLALLTAEFEAAGWSPATLDDEQTFAELVAKLVDAFTNAAAKQPLLQPQIQIQILQEANHRLGQLVQQQDTQIALQQQMVALLQRFAPLDLNEVEQPYLRQLYRQCNDLPLIRERRGLDRDRARLQRVYVELYLDEPPSIDRLLQRLAIRGKKRRQAAIDAILALCSSNTGRIERLPPIPTASGAAHKGERVVPAENDSSHSATPLKALHELTPEQVKELGEALKVEEADLTAAVANLTPLEALSEHRQLVILGDPGSGKSTYTQRLAALFAAAICNDPEIRGDLDQSEVVAIEVLLETMGRPLLPVRVILSQWAKALDSQSDGCADDLIDECVRLLARTTAYGAEQKKHFVARLQGEAPTALLLLDGLDEVSDERQRAVILKAVAAFQESYDRVPMIITCRIRPYQTLQATLDCKDFTLAPLELMQMERFLTRWYTELLRAGIYESAVRAHEKQQALTKALQEKRRRELYEMAQTPLLLTSMAHINYWHGLPDSRAKLYEYLVHQLLYEWERQKQGENDGLLPLETLLVEVKLEINQFSTVLNQVAYDLHSRQHSTDTVEIAHAALRSAFAPLHKGAAPAREGWVAAMLELIAGRSGLIYATDTTPGSETYRFSHRTFQEYLAARHLATGDTETKVKNFEHHIDEEGWYEAVLLGIGYMAEAQPPQVDDILTLMVRLLPSDLTTAQAPQRLLLFGEAYSHILRPERAQQAADKERAGRVHQRFIEQLTAAMQHPTLPPRQRLDAGLLLTELETGPADVDDLVKINAGPKLGIEFKIGKYPVTNAQFRRFFDDDGYNTERWWSEAGVKAKAEYGYREPRYWDNTRFNRNSQPVVGISWYEAEAYCNWLTVRWRADNTIGHEEMVRLPTQAEWEAAARNKHGKEYPWGSDAFDAARANTEESNLAQTSPVHMYPGGVSADGVWDMSGNVFEWTSDLNKDGDPYAKGGSWYTNKDYAKASAADGWFNPGRRNWHFNLGCRVVVVPISR